ncbi:MAG: hypothetical protein HC822_07425 [Oscillochloris sp.]|nr:hypothetical protein [Oscillochloris sp.]
MAVADLGVVAFAHIDAVAAVLHHALVKPDHILEARGLEAGRFPIHQPPGSQVDSAEFLVIGEEFTYVYPLGREARQLERREERPRLSGFRFLMLSHVYAIIHSI